VGLRVLSRTGVVGCANAMVDKDTDKMSKKIREEDECIV